LKSTNPRDFFSMCRQANISFDISKRAGTLFFVPGDMTAGTLILISISKINAIFLKKKSLKMSSNHNFWEDEYYFWAEMPNYYANLTDFL